MTATGIGARGAPQGRPSLHHRQGPLHRRHQPAGPGPRRISCARRTPMPRSQSIDIGRRAAMPGVRRRCFTGDDLAADKIGGLICGWMIHSKDGSPMKAGAASGAGAGQGALCRRPCRGGHRRDAGAGAGRGRDDRGRLRRAAGRRRHGQGADGRQPRGPRRGVADNTRLSTGISATRPTTEARLRARPRTSPSSTSSTTGWCRTRWSRAPRSANTTRARSSFHALHHEPEPACRAARHLGLRRHRAGAQAARDRARCRRRLRLEDLHLCRGGRLPLGGEARSKRPVKWTSRPHRGLPLRRAWPRPRHPCRAGDRRGRQDHRRCGSRRSPISAPTCRPSRRRCRPISTRTLLSGQYDIPAIYCEVDAVYTNTAPVDAYRGAGRPEATFVVERLVEVGGARARHRPGRVPPAEFRHEASRTRRRSSWPTTPATTTPR